MATIRPEVTGRKASALGIAAAVGIGHNRGPPLESFSDWIELQRIISLKEAARYANLVR